RTGWPTRLGTAVKTAVEMEPLEHRPFRRLLYRMALAGSGLRRASELDRHTAVDCTEIYQIQLDQILDKGTGSLFWRGGIGCLPTQGRGGDAEARGFRRGMDEQRHTEVGSHRESREGRGILGATPVGILLLIVIGEEELTAIDTPADSSHA